MNKKKNMASGFTLIEVMVVVVILAILAAIIVPRILSRPEQAKLVAVKQDILAIQNAMALYKLDNGFYPTTSQGIQALVTKPSGSPEAKNWNPEGYLKKLPKDPWGNPYQYISPGAHGAFDLYSWGVDGQEGGTDKAADIVSWEL